MNNTYLAQQCNMMLSSIDIFRRAAKTACIKDDGRIDRQEQKALNKIEKDLDVLEKTLRNIVQP